MIHLISIFSKDIKNPYIFYRKLILVLTLCYTITLALDFVIPLPNFYNINVVPFLTNDITHSLDIMLGKVWGFIPSWIASILIFFSLSINKYSGRMVSLLLKDRNIIFLLTAQIITGLWHLFIYYLSLHQPWYRLVMSVTLLFSLEIILLIFTLVYSYVKLGTLDPEKLGQDVIYNINRSISLFRTETKKKNYAHDAITGIRQLSNIVKQLVKEGNFEVANHLVLDSLNLWNACNFSVSDLLDSFHGEDLKYYSNETTSTPIHNILRNEFEEMISSIIIGPKKHTTALIEKFNEVIIHSTNRTNINLPVVEFELAFAVCDELINKTKRSHFNSIMDNLETTYVDLINYYMHSENDQQKRTFAKEAIPYFLRKTIDLYKTSLDSNELYFIRRVLRMVIFIYNENRVVFNSSQEVEVLFLILMHNEFFQNFLRQSVESLQQKRFKNLVEVYKYLVLNISPAAIPQITKVVYEEISKENNSPDKNNKRYYLMKFLFVWLAFYQLQQDNNNTPPTTRTLGNYVQWNIDLFIDSRGAFDILIKSLKTNIEHWDILLLGASEKYFSIVERQVRLHLI